MINLEDLAEALKDVIAFGAENGSSLSFVHYEVSALDPTTIHVTVNNDKFCHGNKEGQRFTIKITHDDRPQPYRYAVKASFRYDDRVKYFDTGSHDLAFAIESRDEIKKVMPAGYGPDATHIEPFFKEVSLVKVRVPWNCQEQPVPEIIPDPLPS